jgi:hypothetical protein
MSEWRKIKDPDDVALSHDGTTIDVLIDHHDGFGNVYIEIPVEFVEREMAKKKPA